MGIGKGEGTITKRAKENRMPIPDKILKQPVLETELLFYYEAFFELCSERSETGSIAIGKIHSYCNFYKLGQVVSSKLIKFVRILNDEALAFYESKKASAEDEKNK